MHIKKGSAVGDYVRLGLSDIMISGEIPIYSDIFGKSLMPKRLDRRLLSVTHFSCSKGVTVTDEIGDRYLTPVEHEKLCVTICGCRVLTIKPTPGPKNDE